MPFSSLRCGFAWPAHTEAQVELTDERSVGEESRTIVMTMVISRDGRYLETRDLDRLVHGVLSAVGLPSLPVGSDAFASLLSDVAAEDWSTWVGAWLGKGEESNDPHARTRLTASAVDSSDAVRMYNKGFLIDLAREAKESGDNDPVASERVLEKAVYSPMTTTLTAELETATMRTVFAERTRTSSASKGKHKVEGRERRTHRFRWVAD